jgi:hypothetical protein
MLTARHANGLGSITCVWPPVKGYPVRFRGPRSSWGFVFIGKLYSAILGLLQCCRGAEPVFSKS